MASDGGLSSKHPSRFSTSLDDGMLDITLEELQQFGLPAPPQWADLPPPPPQYSNTDAATTAQQTRVSAHRTAPPPVPPSTSSLNGGIDIPCAKKKEISKLQEDEENRNSCSHEDAERYLNDAVRHATSVTTAAAERNTTSEAAVIAERGPSAENIDRKSSAGRAVGGAGDALLSLSSSRSPLSGELLPPDEYHATAECGGTNNTDSIDSEERVQKVLCGGAVTGNAEIDSMIREGLEKFTKSNELNGDSTPRASIEEESESEERDTTFDPDQTQQLNRHMLMAFRNLINNEQLPEAAKRYYRSPKRASDHTSVRPTSVFNTGDFSDGTQGSARVTQGASVGSQGLKDDAVETREWANS